jgi:acyl carrier protein
VRDAIAQLANIPPNYVRAQDAFDDDLVHFDFWGSLDSIALVSQPEESLGTKISDDEACQIVDPENVAGTTVAEFVQKVLRVVVDAET